MERGVLLLSTRSSCLTMLLQPYISFLLLHYFFLIITEFVSCCFTDLFGIKEAKLLSHSDCFYDVAFSHFTLRLYIFLRKMCLLYTVNSCFPIKPGNLCAKTNTRSFKSISISCNYYLGLTSIYLVALFHVYSLLWFFIPQPSFTLIQYF